MLGAPFLITGLFIRKYAHLDKAERLSDIDAVETVILSVEGAQAYEVGVAI